MHKYFRCLYIVSLFISACQKQPVVIQRDRQINIALQQELGKINRQLIIGFASQQPKQVLPLCSDELAKKGANSFISIMQQVGQNFDAARFHIKNQFYIQHERPGASTSLIAGNGTHQYTLNFPAANEQQFVMVGYFDNKVQDLALTCIYGKYGTRWKLNALQVGLMRISDKDASDWFEQAQRDFAKGYLATAANDMVICNLVSQPANRFWHYSQEGKYQSFDKQLSAALNHNYTFPLTINSIPSHPQIFRIFPQGMNKGYFPMVLYKSGINLKDTIALSKECDAINQQLDKVFSGLSLGNKYMFFRAYEKIPAEGEQAANHGFVRTGKL
jgi:hypothetical protein